MHRLRDRIGCLSCALVALGLVGVGLYAAATSVVVQGMLVAVFALVLWIALRERHRVRRSIAEFRRVHGRDGRDLLLVYSDSPHWRGHVEERWLPRWGDHAVVLNRSAPRWTERPEAALWRGLTGHHDHTPVAIVIPARGKVRVFRFREAFHDYTHGKPARLHALELELTHALLSSRP